jgi:hypothetical protein
VRWLGNNRNLATFGTGEVGVINVDTKTWEWQTKGFNGDWFQSPYDAELLPDGNLAVAVRFNDGGRVDVYNRSTGQVVWRHLLSNAHSVRYRTSEQSYQTTYPTLLVGGWGRISEVAYQPSGGQQVTWSVRTEFTHDAIVVENDQILTTEGYYIQKIRRDGDRIWRHDTPDENRRMVVNPDGGYIYTVGEGDRVEFRDSSGALMRHWSVLSDGTRLNYPYGIALITDWAGQEPPPDGSPLFEDDFESGTLSKWNVSTGGDGSAGVQSDVVQSGSFSARLTASSNTGSRALARAHLSTRPADVTVSGWFRVAHEGAVGGNVPLLRFFNESSMRVVQLYRQNQSDNQVWVQHSGNFHATAGRLPLGSWAHIEMRLVVAGMSSQIQVRLNGTQIYATQAAALAGVGIDSVQIGNDTAAQPFDLVADEIIIHGAADSDPTPTPNPTPSPSPAPSPTATPSPSPTSSPTATPGPNVHVADLDATSVNAGKNWITHLRITVHDAAHQDAAGAVVATQWSTGVGSITTCTTDAGGHCTISSGEIPKRVGSVTVTVSEILDPGLPYDANANHDPDGDSNGTRIVIPKP